MLGAYASVAVICAASLVVGQAILVLGGRRDFTWLAGPVGLAALLVAAGIAIRLPGHGTAVAITVAVLVVLAGLGLARSRPGGVLAALPLGIAAALLALLVVSIPFIVNGRVGILGVGLVNDDMASHLLIADWLNTRVGEMPVLIHQGYPVGPHSLAAGLSEGLGTGLIQAFAGLTLAVPVLTALVVLQLLRALRPAPRIAVAALVALPYLAAAYLAQEAFKEPIEALFVLGFAILMPGATTARRALPLAVIAAGSVYAYSFPGLFWLVATAVAWVAVEIARRGRMPTGPSSLVRSAGPTAIAALAVVLVLTAPEWGRIIDFTHFRAFRNSALSGGLGNLHHQVSPLEALGIWPTSDFRISASDASGPTIAFYLGALLAAVGLALGLPRWLRRQGAAVPAALAAAIVIYLGALAFGTVYTSAKALAIAAPLVTLIIFGGLLDPQRGGGGRRDGARRLLAVVIAAGMILSSFLVLRQAPVAPQNHADQLAELRPELQGRKVLFLGRDNFVAYELRGSRPFTAVRNFYDPNFVKPNLRLNDVFQKFDFDSVTPRTLDRFPYVITTRADYASGPPPGFEPVQETEDFVLWRRTAEVGRRGTLHEGDRPGAALDCSRPGARRVSRGGGTAAVFAAAPVIAGNWSPSATVESGSTSSLSMGLRPGRWRISIQYDATRPLTIEAPGLNATVPGNLDYRGSVPFYPVGEITVRRGLVRFTATVQRPPLAGRLLGAKSVAHLGTLAATRVVGPQTARDPIPGDADLKVPLRNACGRYVDWYRATGRR